MKHRMLTLAVLNLILSTLAYSCAPPATAIPAPTTEPTATRTAIPTSIPTATPQPTATDTPEPTPIPGVEVQPASSLAKGIPWLPYDKTRLVISVYYGFNLKKAPFANVLVRQAFAAAVDREQVAQKALGYYFVDARPATSLTPPQVLSRDLYNDVGIPFDPAQAKELLAQAGFADPGSFPPTTLLVSTRGKGAPGAYYQMAKLIADMWQTHLGITVTIESAEIKSYPARFAADPPSIYQLGWVADYNDPDNFLKALFRSDSAVNFGHFSNAEFDRLVDDAALSTEPENRLLNYLEAERILTEQEAAIIPLYHSYRPTPYTY